MTLTRNHTWRFFRFVVAALLLVAALSKLFKTAEILGGDGLLSSPTVLFSVIGVEGGIATYLVFGGQFASWVLALSTFSVLTGFAAYATATGKDCNCISQSISPSVMLLVDITVLVLTTCCKPLRNPVSTPDWKAHIGLAAIFGIALSTAAIAFDSTQERSDPLKFLLADSWIGKAWPLDASFHKQLEQLEHGKWVVLVLREGCPKCDELMQTYFQGSKTTTPNAIAIFTAGRNEWPFQFGSQKGPAGSFVSFPDREPFVASPAVFTLEDGIVVSAKDGDEAEPFVRDLLASSVP